MPITPMRTTSQGRVRIPLMSVMSAALALAVTATATAAPATAAPADTAAATPATASAADTTPAANTAPATPATADTTPASPATAAPADVAPRAVGAGAPLASPTPAPTPEIPDSPVGEQLRWLLEASAALPIPEDQISAHFSAAFLEQISPAQLNGVLQSLGGLRLESLADVTPTTLTGVVTTGVGRLQISMAVDGDGRIAALLFQQEQRAGTAELGRARPAAARAGAPGGVPGGRDPRERHLPSRAHHRAGHSAAARFDVQALRAGRDGREDQEGPHCPGTRS